MLLPCCCYFAIDAAMMRYMLMPLSLIMLIITCHAIAFSLSIFAFFFFRFRRFSLSLMFLLHAITPRCHAAIDIDYAA